MKNIELAKSINDLLENEKSAHAFIDQFNKLLPEIDRHFRTHTSRIFDRLSDEYYDEFRTPLAQIRLKALRSILANTGENYRKGREQIIKLFEKRKVADIENKNLSSIVVPKSAEHKDEVQTSNENDSDIKKFIKVTKEIIQQQDEEIKKLNRISRECIELINTDFVKNFKQSNQTVYKHDQPDIKQPEEHSVEKKHQPELNVKEYSEIIQFNKEVDEYQSAIWEMIKNISKFFYSRDNDFNDWDQIINGNLFNHDHTELLNQKIPRKIIHDFAMIVQIFIEIDPNIKELLQKNIDKYSESTCSSGSKIRSVFKLFNIFFILIQDRERTRIQTLKNKKIKHLFNYFVHKIEDDDKIENEQKDPPENFIKFCEAIIKGEDYSSINISQFGLSQTELELLKRDLNFVVKEDLQCEIGKSLTRIQHIYTIITGLQSECGDDAIDCWENHIVSLDLQKDRTRALNIKALAQLFSGGLAAGEGAVAAIGNYGLLGGFSPALAGVVVGPTLFGGAGCNYAMVVGDTEDTFKVMQGGLAKLHKNNQDEELSPARKALLWILSCLPSFVSGACYGSLGGLSTIATISLVLGFFGISLIPVVGWIFFGVGIFTGITVYSILFIATGDPIRNVTWKDVKNYFNKRFYWPSKGNTTEKTIAFIKNAFNTLRIAVSAVVIAGLLFIIGVKLFATSLITFFAKCAWGGSVANKVANGLSYINSSIWFYFNFKKGSSLLEIVSTDAPLKIIPYTVEITFRTICLAIPAIFCLVVQIISWPFSSKISNKFLAYFDKILDQTAPHSSRRFFNNNKFLRSLSRRSHSGVDETSEERGPMQITRGIIQSTLGLIKLAPPALEITARLAVGLVYRVTWPIRVVVRKIHNTAYQHSEGYRQFAKKLHLKERYREANLGDMIVPRFWHKITTFVSWLRAPVNIPDNSPSVIPKVVQSAQSMLSQTADMAVNINAAGQGQTFATGGSSNLPRFLQSTAPALQQAAAGMPQAICSAALGQGACRSMLSSKQYVSLTIVGNQNGVFGKKLSPPPPPGPRPSPGSFKSVY